MSLPLDSDLWSPSLARRVDAVCNRFEGAHRAGRRPRIADYLAEAPAEEHPVLLRELLALDLAYRSQSGDAATPEEYVGQFPDHAELIGDVFRETASGPPDTPPGRETPHGRGEGPSWTPLLNPATHLEPPREAPAPRPASATPDLPGYEILNVLGHGGMGIVFRARHLRLKRLVALKMLLTDADPETHLLERLRAEAEAVARLQHPHIVQIYDIGEWRGQPYLALEYVEGGSLAEKLDAGPLPPTQAARLLETVARAVHHAHQHGIIHRDLKPGNILLQRKATTDHTEDTDKNKNRPGISLSVPSVSSVVDCLPKITDFGLAKRLDADVGRTQSGAVVGTPMYMAPEQAEARNREVGPAADVHALGVILYESLTGRPPFRGATVLETLDQVRTQDPVPPSRLQPKVPRDLETICLKCLRKEPTKRYASAADLADDLGRFLKGEPIRARPTPAWERLLKWARRRKAVAALVAVLIVVLGGSVAGGLWYYRQQARAAAKEQAGRRTVQELLSKGYQALSGGDGQGAGSRAGEALTLIQNAAPALDDLTADAGRLRDEARDHLASEQQRIAQEQARRRVLDKRAKFNHLRDEALFHGTLFTGTDLVTNVRASEKAALLALGEFGVAPDAETGPVFEGPFEPAEKEEITSRCYELLLILAEAKAQQGPERAREALAVLDRAGRLAPPTRTYYLRRARYLDLLRDADGARKERDRAEALTPAGALDDFLMGVDEQRQGDLTAAIGHLQDALRSDPGHFWARYFLAVCYLRTQRRGEALAAKDSLTACLNQREFVWVYVLRGFVHGRLNEFSAAEDDFGKAAQLDPSDEDVRYSIALGRGVLRMLQQKYPEAAGEFEEAARLKPDRYEPRLNLAEAYEQQKRPDLAVGQLDQAVALAAAQPAVVQVLYRTRAGLHERRKDLDSALSDLQRAIDQEPRPGKSSQLAEDHAKRGQLLQQLGKYRDAVTAYEAALKVRPTLASAHLGRGEALLKLEEYKEAGRAFDEYLRHVEKGKESPDVYRARGMTRAWLLDYPGAVEDYTRALGSRRDAPTLVLRGWAYLFQESPAVALRDFQEAIDLDPNNGEAYGGRGYAHVRLGQWRRGVADAEKALACGPEQSPRLLCTAARVFAQAVGRIDAERDRAGRQSLEERSGYQDQAVRLLRRAVELHPRAERRTFWRKIIAADDALLPIRGSPGYTQLEAEFARGG
jgi:serine/threonine protein kinase/Tfp pilus assembly protein PilF